MRRGPSHGPARSWPDEAGVREGGLADPAARKYLGTVGLLQLTRRHGHDWRNWLGHKGPNLLERHGCSTIQNTLKRGGVDKPLGLCAVTCVGPIVLYLGALGDQAV